MYATRTQKALTYLGYWANGFARESARAMERLTRPMPTDENAYWTEAAERVRKAVLGAVSLPLAAIFSLPALACYGLAACAGGGKV